MQDTPPHAWGDVDESRRGGRRPNLAGPFDVVRSRGAIYPLGNARKRALYQEILDLLSEGGVFLNAEHVADSKARVEKMLDASIKLVLFAGGR
jgi:SAM-dependent methyltransferase